MKKAKWDFYPVDVWDDTRDYLQKWVDNDELVGIVDEEIGGVVAYVHRDWAERVIDRLNGKT